MSKMLEKMTNFLSGYGCYTDEEVNKLRKERNSESYNEGDLWQKISSMNLHTNPCMDIYLDIIDEDDFYGVNFTGKQKVYILFFTGSSDYFPAIWIGENDENKLDEMPIYILDLSSDNDTFECKGNFRNYIETILNDFIITYKKDDEYMKDAKFLQEEVKKFSNHTFNKNNYKLDVID